MELFAYAGAGFFIGVGFRAACWFERLVIEFWRELK